MHYDDFYEAEARAARNAHKALWGVKPDETLVRINSHTGDFSYVRLPQYREDLTDMTDLYIVPNKELAERSKLREPVVKFTIALAKKYPKLVIEYKRKEKGA